MASPREDGELQETSSSSEEETDDDDNSSSAVAQLKFKNDGSFLEMFKKMQESAAQQANKETNKTDSKNEKGPTTAESSSTDKRISATTSKDASSATPPVKKPGLMSIVGKRRGGKALPVGVVKKQKRPEDEEDPSEKKDAWSQYLSEVKKYKERLGDEEEKNRPLVK